MPISFEELKIYVIKPLNEQKIITHKILFLVEYTFFESVKYVKLLKKSLLR